jgi:acyl carrier protein
MTDPLLIIINRVRAGKKLPPLAALHHDDRLREDLGLASLDLAELTARLEEKFGVDIFADGLVRSVAEVRAKLPEEKSP